MALKLYTKADCNIITEDLVRYCITQGPLKCNYSGLEFININLWNNDLCRGRRVVAGDICKVALTAWLLPSAYTKIVRYAPQITAEGEGAGGGALGTSNLPRLTVVASTYTGLRQFSFLSSLKILFGER